MSESALAGTTPARSDSGRPTPFGVVAIGRNEAERLRSCLASVGGGPQPVVYVDSGSSDGSPQMARQLGVDVVDLDMGIPFTAARARNEGFRRLRAMEPGLAYVQFVDADCEVVAGWLDAAVRFLDDRPDVAAVCGRRRERFPERSVYNRLCDIEWDTPIGEARACGGDVMLRADVLEAVGGYRDDLIAGEDSELSVRLRGQHWKIWRLDLDMTLHDAAMTRLGQWWRRSYRAGYAFAAGVALHGAPPERHFQRESKSALVWGAAVPLVIVLLALVRGPVTLWALAIYPLQVGRLYLAGRGAPGTRLARAGFLVLGKFAEAAGQFKFFLHRLAGKSGRLIEYK